MVFEDEIVNNNAFEHAGLIFTEPWALTNKIKLNIIQNFKSDFLENKFWAEWGVCFKFLIQNLTYFFHRIFFNVRGILELKNDTTILRKNGSFANKTCCTLTALFVKMQIVLRESPYGSICNAKGRICTWTSLVPAQDINLTRIHKMGFLWNFFYFSWFCQRRLKLDNPILVLLWSRTFGPK